ncbi:MAG: thiamine pyrophosphate-dependent dehydrogenase E1 component subunit alpha [Elusimicrobia bacterium]|nr:thiamine pyrophosphate-dependent dehydrogenase E1 component subunit alpha [Elusimicrobiota bacterium]
MNKFISQLSPELAQKFYLSLLRCRKFEEKIVELYPQQEMRCPTHLSLGQEGVAAGVCSALEKEDLIFSTHRCHSHTIAKGADLNVLMAELYGKKTGCSKGKGGSMHFLQPEIGAMGASAIVGGTIPLAIGAALALKMKSKNHVSVAFFGDGAIEQGTFHEGLNFASLKKLPVLFICENNGLATCTPISSRQPFPDIYKRAESYMIPGIQVDGRNVHEVYQAAAIAVEKAKKGEGPTLIEAQCYRWREHVGPNFDYQLGFRSKEEVEKAIEKCPIKLLEEKIKNEKILSKEILLEISDLVTKEVDEAVNFAKESPFPEPEEIFMNI